MQTAVLRIALTFSMATAAALTQAQSGAGGALTLQTEMSGGRRPGRINLNHTVQNVGPSTITNVWLTNLLATAMSPAFTNRCGPPGGPACDTLFRTTPLAPGVTFDAGFTATNPPAVAIAIGDLDRDGWPDIVTTHGTNAGGGAAWHVIPLTGGSNPPPSGPLSVPTNLPVPHGLRAPSIGDINGDGIPDIVAASVDSNEVLTYLEDGGVPDFQYFAGPSLSFANPITSVVVVDFDRDGRMDLVVLEPAAATVHLLRNTFDSGLAAFTEVATLTTPDGPTAMVVARRGEPEDCDDMADIFVTCDSTGQVAVFRNTCPYDTLAPYQPATFFACGATPRDIAVGDLDGDGLPDLAVANGPARAITLLRQTPGGDFLPAGIRSISGAAAVGSVRVLDLDGDGRPELITGINGVAELVVIPNSRTNAPLHEGQFGAAVVFPLDGPFRNLGADTCVDGPKAGAFVVVGHTGPNQGALAGGQSFSRLVLTQPGAVLEYPLGDLLPGHAASVEIPVEVRVPDGTNVAVAAGDGGVTISNEARDKIPLAVICGSIYCVSGGVTQGLGGFAVTVVISGTGYYYSNSTVSMPNGMYCLDLPFSCGGVFPWDTIITVTSPGCPGQVWTFPIGVLFSSMTIPPVYCSNCNSCSTVQSVLNLFSGSGSSGLLAIGSLDPQFATGIPPFSTANPYVTTASGGWLANGPNSQWVGPDPAFQSAPDVYCYTNRFFLTCTNNARLMGQWTVAGEGEVLLNGALTGNSLGLGSESSFFLLNLAGGFVPGWNELVFCVTNPPSSIGLPQNPTGLRVELTGTAICCAACVEINCPQNLVVGVCTNGPAPIGAVTNYPPPFAVSHCGQLTSVVCTPPSGSFFPLGTNTVTCTATDSLGNSAVCSFKVIVRPDFTPPIVLQCPPLNISVTGCPPVMPLVTTNVVAVDNCSSPGQIIITQDIPPGTPLPGGQTVATVQICDANGNCTYCDVIINAVPTSGFPTITCPPNQVLITCGTNAIGTFKTMATGQNGPVVCTPPSGSPFPLGVTYVTCTATNNCGGTATCYFAITVRPPPPRWPCPPRQLGIGIPFELVGGATAALRPAPGGIGLPAVCIFPNPANPASGVLLQPGQAQAITFTTELSFDAPEGAGLDIALPPDATHPDGTPLLSFSRKSGPQGYCVKANKRLIDDPAALYRSVAIGTNGELFSSITWATNDMDTNVLLNIFQLPGVTSVVMTVSIDCRTREITLDLSHCLWTYDARRKGWDGCIYGNRPPSSHRGRLILTPVTTVVSPPVTELALMADGLPEVLIEEPTITATGGRKWGDGHVTLMKAYDDGDGLEFVALAPGGGVHVDLGHSESFEMRLTKFETNGLPGEDLLTRTIGPIALTNRPPPPFLDAMLLHGTPDGVECSADFSNIDSPTVHVVIYFFGMPVAERTGVPAQLGNPLFTLPEWPATLGKFGGATPCRRGTIPPGPIRLPGSGGLLPGGPGGEQIVFGDEFRVLAELAPGAAHPDFYSGFEFITSEGADWGITELQRTSACAPVAMNIERGADGVVITWPGEGFRLEGAENVTGPWFNLGTSSPSAVPSPSPARFFRLNCE